mmetsp:Transcript_12944/g.38677  ORF Transcript_12944/g.38677 Transcript_12944/m.38677 type:complete len:187 (-) Transcript_12944:579-1139(-)|eukprot:CAMPEP_0118862474 /NCGR_PEP_ID=MMETSP1163-20130328/7667_1 /TAXON_ID=124430 /ORGANISM="Phaeomonas parva, Strain CCMP2877" /LENGTH=186 /DNA_ID=CAMNT_0006796385 /DNA_START=154 /DNA_END=714 /DNA_ORIENTATION=+
MATKVATPVATAPRSPGRGLSPTWSLTEARTGRELQRYDNNVEGDTDKGVRLCCGCVPLVWDAEAGVRVLIVSSRKKAWTLPKGGWEDNETADEAALRECWEEAGAIGELLTPKALCEAEYDSAKKAMRCRVRFYALRVTEILDQWPEIERRERMLVGLDEARRLIQKEWQHRALDAVEAQLALLR